ncbi:hypothetical protein L1887_06511 [Cichorium endivia]|nr:hypothetical protein L1887_06511 [Cichorium endivia]
MKSTLKDHFGRTRVVLANPGRVNALNYHRDGNKSNPEQVLKPGSCSFQNPDRVSETGSGSDEDQRSSSVKPGRVFEPGSGCVENPDRAVKRGSGCGVELGSGCRTRVGFRADPTH